MTEQQAERLLNILKIMALIFLDRPYPKKDLAEIRKAIQSL